VGRAQRRELELVLRALPVHLDVVEANAALAADLAGMWPLQVRTGAHFPRAEGPLVDLRREPRPPGADARRRRRALHAHDAPGECLEAGDEEPLARVQFPLLRQDVAVAGDRDGPAELVLAVAV